MAEYKNFKEYIKYFIEFIINFYVCCTVQTAVLTREIIFFQTHY